MQQEYGLRLLALPLDYVCVPLTARRVDMLHHPLPLPKRPPQTGIDHPLAAQVLEIHQVPIPYLLISLAFPFIRAPILLPFIHQSRL